VVPHRLFVLMLAAAFALVAVPASAADWPTYHGDTSRQGDDTSDPGLAAPLPSWNRTLDGRVYAQPVVAGNQLIAVTEQNSVYSLSPVTGAIQWHVKVPGISTATGGPRTSGFPCGNINPLGITSTPVIDAGYVYVLAEIQQTGSSNYYFDLAKINLASGAIAWQRDINPGQNGSPSDSHFDPNYQQQRGALTVTAGRVLVGLGGLSGDCGQYRGYVLSYPESASGNETWWSAASNDSNDNEGAIWSTGGGSVDATGYLYVSTGNSNHTSSSDGYDFSDSVVKLNPTTLTVADYFAPNGEGGGPTWYGDNAGDVDLGSTTPLQLPNNRVFVVGKSGMGYLMSSASLGHLGGELAHHRVCSATNDAVFGSLAFSYVSGIESVYVGCNNGTTRVNIAGSNNDFSVAVHDANGYSDKPPIVAGGALWVVDDSNVLHELDLGDLHQLRSFPVVGHDHFTSPSAANGWLFVAGGSGVSAFEGDLGPAPQVPDLGRYNAGTASPNHWVTTGGVSTAYTGSPGAEEFSIGLLRSAAASGFTALYGCQAGTVHFVSHDPSCEGQQVLRTEGYTSNTAAAPYTLQIYRCRVASNNDHFVSTSSSCEGQAGEGSLGYIEPRSGLERFVVPARHWTADGSVATGYQPESVLGYVASVGGSGAPLYECLIGNDHFTSRDPGCEGQHRYTFLGWISAAGSSQPLYRCYKGGAHFDTTSSSCEGLGTPEVVLGNVFTSA
jgi:polyvinyl alcohol dehydrogenase (cytochrome)